MNREVVVNLFKKVARILEDDKQYEWLADEVKDYLNEIYVNEESEQEPGFNFDLERMKAAIESPISDVTVDDLMRQPEQEPVAWITEWVQRYRHNDTPIIDRAVSFTKGDAPAVPNPNYIPLYASPPKHQGGY